jgi:hypothetical protein
MRPRPHRAHHRCAGQTDHGGKTTAGASCGDFHKVGITQSRAVVAPTVSKSARVEGGLSMPTIDVTERSNGFSSLERSTRFRFDRRLA